MSDDNSFEISGEFYFDTSGDSGTTESDNDEKHAVDVFDTNIPTMHSYLGKLDDVRGYTLYEVGEVLTLPAIYTSTLVFPGFTLPLLISNGEYDFKANNFVLVWLTENGRTVFDYGVVMEVFEHDVQRGVVNLKARARQRCFILRQQKPLNVRHQMCKANVRILPEPDVTSPLSCTQLNTLRAHYTYKWQPKDAATTRTMHRRRMHAAQSPIPLWVHDRNEVDYHVNFISTKLRHEYDYPPDVIPQDPIVLSYWFAQNYQLMDHERLDMLQSNSTLDRLRIAVRCLLVERTICCVNCSAVISHPKEALPMSKDGVQSNYVNPGGVVVEAVTLRNIENFVMLGHPSSDFSWFPGYSWMIVQCAKCGNHLGWRFSARKLQPTCFYGLARSCLRIIACKASQKDST